jgi:hypothetical protein
VYVFNVALNEFKTKVLFNRFVCSSINLDIEVIGILLETLIKHNYNIYESWFINGWLVFFS